MCWKNSSVFLGHKLIQYVNEMEDYEELRQETLRHILFPILGHIWYIHYKYLLG